MKATTMEGSGDSSDRKSSTRGVKDERWRDDNSDDETGRGRGVDREGGADTMAPEVLEKDIMDIKVVSSAISFSIFSKLFSIVYCHLFAWLPGVSWVQIEKLILFDYVIAWYYFSRWGQY